MKNKAVFFDRDKTIILPNNDNYIYRVGDFYIPEEYVAALRNLTENNYLLFVVTNQGRVAKGYLTEDDVNEVHRYMDKYFRQFGVEIKEFAYCPHNPEGNIEPYNILCSCRKPESEMIEKLIQKYHIDVSESWMIGDSRKDVIAGNSAGLKTILVQTGYFNTFSEADFVEENFSFAAKRILTAGIKNNYNK
ncbi:MAG: D-glycero-alpha-D-manno-heptose-1,7-bisphosphate 7-phosphatase [Thermodesulfobacteriota bacterium]